MRDEGAALSEPGSQLISDWVCSYIYWYSLVLHLLISRRRKAVAVAALACVYWQQTSPAKIVDVSSPSLFLYSSQASSSRITLSCQTLYL